MFGVFLQPIVVSNVSVGYIQPFNFEKSKRLLIEINKNKTTHFIYKGYKKCQLQAISMVIFYHNVLFEPKSQFINLVNMVLSFFWALASFTFHFTAYQRGVSIITSLLEVCFHNC